MTTDTDAQFSITGAEPTPAGPAFARHETFHPRHGWLKKGFDAATHDPGVFTRPDATVTLGVGKNMVRAIRYWCHAFGLLEAGAEGSRPSRFGTALLADDGWDPYLEDPASLWLLHERLVQPRSMATAWEYAFSGFPRAEFTPDDLQRALEELVTRVFPGSRIAASSIRKDVTCVLRMYAPGEALRFVSEESIRCPFVELGLLSEGVATGAFAFVFGEKPGLTADFVAAASLRFAASSVSSARTVSLSRLLRDPGAPGSTFKLTESSLYSALEEAAELHPALSLGEAGGLVQLTFDEPPLEIADALTAAHYGATLSGVR